MRSAIVALCGVIGYFYYVHVYSLPKLEYNAVRGGGAYAEGAPKQPAGPTS